RCAGRGGCSGRRRRGRRRGTAAKAIEQSHGRPLQARMVTARSSQVPGTDERRSVLTETVCTRAARGCTVCGARVPAGLCARVVLLVATHRRAVLPVR